MIQTLCFTRFYYPFVCVNAAYAITCDHFHLCKTMFLWYNLISVVIEENQVVLKAGLSGKELDSFSTPTPLLDCDHYKPFWVRWADSKLEFGKLLI